MKAMLILMVIVAGIFLVVWQFGGYATLDPTQQGEDARAAIKPGMSWKQVIDQTTTPRKFCEILRKTKMVGDEEIEFFRPSAPMRFDLADFTRSFDEERYSWGFRFDYAYSSSVAFTVEFDAAGDVVYLADTLTMADLLQKDDD